MSSSDLEKLAALKARMASLGVKSAGVPATASAPSEGSSDPDKQSHSLAATAPSAVGVHEKHAGDPGGSVAETKAQIDSDQEELDVDLAIAALSEEVIILTEETDRDPSPSTDQMTAVAPVQRAASARPANSPSMSDIEVAALSRSTDDAQVDYESPLSTTSTSRRGTRNRGSVTPHESSGAPPVENTRSVSVDDERLLGMGFSTASSSVRNRVDHVLGGDTAVPNLDLCSASHSSSDSSSERDADGEPMFRSQSLASPLREDDSGKLSRRKSGRRSSRRRSKGDTPKSEEREKRRSGHRNGSTPRQRERREKGARRSARGDGDRKGTSGSAIREAPPRPPRTKNPLMTAASEPNFAVSAKIAAEAAMSPFGDITMRGQIGSSSTNASRLPPDPYNNMRLKETMLHLDGTRGCIEAGAAALSVLDDWNVRPDRAEKLSAVIGDLMRSQALDKEGDEELQSEELSLSPSLTSLPTATSGSDILSASAGDRNSTGSVADKRRAALIDDRKKRRNSIRSMIRKRATGDKKESSENLQDKAPQQMAEGLLSGELINSLSALKQLRQEVNHASADWKDVFLNFSGVSALFKVFQRAQGETEEQTAELMQIASDCLCSLLVSHEQSAQIILKPPLLVQAVKLMETRRPSLITVGAGLLLNAAQIPRRGCNAVMEAFTMYSESPDKVFEPIVDALTTVGSTTDHQVTALSLLNCIILQLTDSSTRFKRLSEVMQGGAFIIALYLMDNVEDSDGKIAAQLDLFVDALRSDWTETVKTTKRKNAVIFLREGQEVPATAGADYLQVLMPHTIFSGSMVIPFKGKTKLASLLELALASCRYFSGYAASDDDFGLFVVSADKGEPVQEWVTVVDEEGNARAISDAGYLGKVLCHFKMLPWTLHVKVPGGRTLRTEVAPESTMSDLVALVVKQSLNRKIGQIDEYSEYGLWWDRQKGFVPADQSLYELGKKMLSTKWLELKAKPRTFRTKWMQRTWDIEIMVEDGMLVNQIFHKVCGRMNLSKAERNRFVLFLEPQIDPLQPESGMVEASKPLKEILHKMKDDPHMMLVVKERPVPVSVRLPQQDGNKASSEGEEEQSRTEEVQNEPGVERTFLLDLGQPISESLSFICHKLGDVDAGDYHLCRLEEDGATSSLFPWVSARDQDCSESTKFALVAKADLDIPDEVDESTKINIWEDEEKEHNCKKEVTGTNIAFLHGTLNILVRYLTNIVKHDSKFMKAFLTTYRSFTTPQVLWSKLLERYRCPEGTMEQTKNLVHMRVLVVLKQWVSRFNDDSERKLLGEISDFLERDGKGSAIAEDVKRTIAKRKQTRQPYKFTEPPPDLIPMKAPVGSAVPHITDVNCKEIARQWTLQEFEWFSQIKPIELFKQAWSKEKLQHLSPNVMGMINHFNDVSSIVSSTICAERKVRERAKVYEHFVMVAQHLTNLKNFNLVIAVISGLNNSSVLRLKWTKARVSKRAQQILEELEALTNMENSYKALRERIKHSSPPIIPYMGVYLADLTFIADGNPDMIGSCINFEKRQMEYKVLEQIETLQVDPYNLKKDDAIAAFLAELPKLDEKEMYRLSLEAEPRNAARSEIE